MQSNYTLIQDLQPMPIVMKLTLVKELLQHADLRRLLKQAQENGQKTLVTIHHHMEDIHRVMEWVKKDGEH